MYYARGKGLGLSRTIRQRRKKGRERGIEGDREDRYLVFAALSRDYHKREEKGRVLWFTTDLTCTVLFSRKVTKATENQVYSILLDISGIM